MLVLSQTTKKVMFRNLVICALAAIIKVTLGKSWYTSAGASWMLVTALDLLQRIFGYLLLPIVAKPVNVINIKEVKHDEANFPVYQYIIREKGREWYTPIFDAPLSKVIVKAYSYSRYRFVKVLYKKKGEK